MHRETHNLLDVLELQRNAGLIPNGLDDPSLHGQGLAQQPEPVHRRIHHQPGNIADVGFHIGQRCVSFSLRAAVPPNLHQLRFFRPRRFRPMNRGTHPARNFVVPVILFPARNLRHIAQCFRHRRIEFLFQQSKQQMPYTISCELRAQVRSIVPPGLP